jgi:hypothetical protein
MVGGPDGTITHTARGAAKDFTNEASESQPVAPAAADCFTASGERSYTEH